MEVVAGEVALMKNKVIASSNVLEDLDGRGLHSSTCPPNLSRF